MIWGSVSVWFHQTKSWLSKLRTKLKNKNGSMSFKYALNIVPDSFSWSRVWYTVCWTAQKMWTDSMMICSAEIIVELRLKASVMMIFNLLMDLWLSARHYPIPIIYLPDLKQVSFCFYYKTMILWFLDSQRLSTSFIRGSTPLTPLRATRSMQLFGNELEEIQSQDSPYFRIRKIKGNHVTLQIKQDSNHEPLFNRSALIAVLLILNGPLLISES